MYKLGKTPLAGANIPWQEALNAPSADQMGYLRKLIESHHLLTLNPDDTILAGERTQAADTCLALRGDGVVLVYTPTGRTLKIHLDSLGGQVMHAAWFNPRSGKTTDVGPLTMSTDRTFDPPGEPEPWHDWVLVLQSSVAQK